MGTREVYEEKLRSGNLYHDPTINPGLGSARCPRCLSLVNPNLEEKRVITSVLQDFIVVAGAGVGAMLGAVHGFNTGIPFIQKHVKGPMWLKMAVGVPPVVLFSGVSAAFGAYAVPAFVQLSASSYEASCSASHYVISRGTRYVEGDRDSRGLGSKSR